MPYFAYSSISDHITINNYYYLLSLCKAKRYNIKWKLNLKKFELKIVRVIISMIISIIKLENFDHNIFIDEKSHENILIYDILYQTLIDSKPLRIRFFKVHGIMRIYDRTTLF